MNPKVSVIVMIYNSEEFLPSCLESIRNQTFRDFEVLMVEDASTDRSLEICKAYAANDTRFRVIHYETNMGMPYCRAVTLQEARGEYIAVLDADDMALPKRLEKQVKYLDTQPELVMVSSYFYIINHLGNHLYVERPPVHDIELRWLIMFGNCLGHSTVMYRKSEAINCGGYNPQILAGEDMEFYSKIMSLGKLAVIPEFLSSWRTHDVNRSKIEPVENKLQFLNTVKDSIFRHSGFEAPLELAAAVFNNSDTMATSSEVFIHALKLTLFATATLMSNPILENEKKLLAKRVYDQLIYLFDRNSRAPWWIQVSYAWTKCVLQVSQIAQS